MSTQISLLIVAVVLVAGCSAPAPSDNPAPRTPLAPWHLEAQRTLGFHLRVQAPLVSSTPPLSEGYCEQLELVVPLGSDVLDLRMASEPMDSTNGTFGLLGFGARSPSGRQWVDNPPASVIQPSAGMAANWTQEAKTIRVAHPEAGAWKIYAYTYGVAHRQSGNMTIGVQGSASRSPESLEIKMTCS